MEKKNVISISNKKKKNRLYVENPKTKREKKRDEE